METIAAGATGVDKLKLAPFSTPSAAVCGGSSPGVRTVNLTVTIWTGLAAFGEVI